MALDEVRSHKGVWVGDALSLREKHPSSRCGDSNYNGGGGDDGGGIHLEVVRASSTGATSAAFFSFFFVSFVSFSLFFWRARAFEQRRRRTCHALHRRGISPCAVGEPSGGGGGGETAYR